MSRLRSGVVAVALLLAFATASAAQVELDVSKIRLGAAPCLFSVGTVAPEGAVSGRPCDIYLRSNGSSMESIFWVKVSGSGTSTGWVSAGPAYWARTGTYVYPMTSGDTVGPTANYSSDLGTYLKKWLTIHAAELRVETLVAADVMATIGGRVLVGPTTTLIADMPASSTVCDVKHNAWVNGDIVVAQGAPGGTPQMEWNAVYMAALSSVDQGNKVFSFNFGGNACSPTYFVEDRTFYIAGGANQGTYTTASCSYADPYTNITVDEAIPSSSVTNSLMAYLNISGGYRYGLTRNLDGSGSNDWVAGDALFSTGVTGDGYIDLYSDRSTRSATHYGPTIVGNVRTGGTWSNLEERWAIGNLRNLFGYADADLYGAAFGSPSASWLKIDPTNGVRLGNNTTTNVQITAGGSASFSGSVTASAGTIGGFTLGATTLSSGTDSDYVALMSGGTNAIQVGDSTFADAKFSVTSAGALKAVSGTIGGFTLAANTLSSGTDADYVAMSSAGTNAFWAGDSTFTDAEFSVTAAGALKATNATLTGSLSAGGGNVTIDADGIELTAGSGVSNKLRWSDDSYINSYTNILTLEGSAFISLSTTNGGVWLENNLWGPAGGVAMSLGNTSYRWDDFWLEDDIHHFGDYYWDSPPTTGDSDYPIVWSSSIKALYRKTSDIWDGSCASGVSALAAENGIFKSATCSAPDESPAVLRAELTAVRQEVAELKAQVAALLAALERRQ